MPATIVISTAAGVGGDRQVAGVADDLQGRQLGGGEGEALVPVGLAEVEVTGEQEDERGEGGATR